MKRPLLAAHDDIADQLGEMDAARIEAEKVAEQIDLMQKEHERQIWDQIQAAFDASDYDDDDWRHERAEDEDTERMAADDEYYRYVSRSWRMEEEDIGLSSEGKDQQRS